MVLQHRLTEEENRVESLMMFLNILIQAVGAKWGQAQKCSPHGAFMTLPLSQLNKARTARTTLLQMSLSCTYCMCDSLVLKQMVLLGLCKYQTEVKLWCFGSKFIHSEHNISSVNPFQLI